jgi:hypothetical protein
VQPCQQLGLNDAGAPIAKAELPGHALQPLVLLVSCSRDFHPIQAVFFMLYFYNIFGIA